MVQEKYNLNNIIQNQIIAPVSDIKSMPKLTSELESQCLFGEVIEIIKVVNSWVYIKSEKDNYKGWIKANTIGKKVKSSHRINNVIANIYNEPNVKSSLLTSLYLNSKICITKQIDYNWFKVLIKNKEGFINKDNVSLENNYSFDWIKVALKFLNTPYLWGGKTYSGIDCSGLVQIALQSSGLNFPRNTSTQIDFESENIFKHEKIEKGCLIFWDGHVGIMLDEKNILHSNVHHLCVQIENIKKTIKRIGKIKAIKKVSLNTR